MQRLVTLLLLPIALSCSQETPTDNRGTPRVESSDEIRVLTVNYPLAYFAERIIADSGIVSFPAPPDVDPAYWSPGHDIIAEYQQADLILLNGAGYASWIASATLPRSRLVDTTAGVADKLIRIEDTVTHTHGPTGDHSHGDAAFTTWLDLDIAKAQAQAVLDALVQVRPNLEAEFSKAFQILEGDLAEADSALREAAEALADAPLLFSHPVYQYLERRYNLNGYSVHWEPGEVPEEAQWRQLQSVLQQHPAKIMIWEGEPLEETRRRLTELGVQSVVFSPGGNRPAEGDWLELMNAGIASLRAQ